MPVPIFIFPYLLQGQAQSATGQLSDEQQSAPHAQSQHPEFPQLQPITNSAAQNAINFFIKTFLLIIYITLLKTVSTKKARHFKVTLIFWLLEVKMLLFY